MYTTPTPQGLTVAEHAALRSIGQQPTGDMPAWSYQAPYNPRGYEEQCYYRTSRQLGHSMKVQGAAPGSPDLTAFRFQRDQKLTITVDYECASASMTLDAVHVLALRDALNDALQDMAQAAALNERRESFDRISAEMAEADEHGGSGCYYCHPDVHYVDADQVQAKVDELQEAGTPFFMVLPHPVGLAA